MEIIFDKLDDKMQSSFWYQGERDIAIFSKYNNKLILSACGEIRVKLKGKDFYRKNQNAVVEALKLGFTDDNLGKSEFDESNWFDFVYKKGNNSYIEIDGDECFSFDEAMKAGHEIINDTEFWKQL